MKLPRVAVVVRARYASSFIVALTVFVACAPVKFTGTADRQTATAPAAPINPSLQPDNPGDQATPAAPSVPATTSSPSGPTACENTIATSGIHDDASGRTFKLMPAPLSYDEGRAACAAAGGAGKLIFAAQDLPDSVLACKQALGVLWLAPSEGASLWAATVTGAEDPSAKHWIICYY